MKKYKLTYIRYTHCYYSRLYNKLKNHFFVECMHFFLLKPLSGLLMELVHSFAVQIIEGCSDVELSLVDFTLVFQINFLLTVEKIKTLY